MTSQEPRRIDLRGMPMDPRHELLFGTLFGLGVGETMEVTNDHDPSGLSHRLAEEHAGRYAWTWLERGPVDWRFRVECLADAPGGTPAPADAEADAAADAVARGA